MNDAHIICNCARRFFYLVVGDDGQHIRCVGCQRRIPIEVMPIGTEGASTHYILEYGLRQSAQELPENGLPPYTTKGIGNG